MRLPKYLTSHSMWSQSDFDYFKGKGYTNREIEAFWDRDEKLGKSPVEHKPVPDVISIIADWNKSHE